MLKIILDTNLFRTDLKGLENYTFSNLYEKLIKYINTAKISDVELCMTETALKEYAKQMADQYQTNVVESYTLAYKIMKDSLPVLNISFRDKYDFMEEYYNGLIERLNELNIKIINTLPYSQVGGMKMNKVLTKTIKNIPPFDKTHNHNLKDAFISETINSSAEDNEDSNFIFITCNIKDFKENTELSSNFKLGFIEENDSKDKVILIMNILAENGAHIDQETLYQEIMYSYKVRNDITNFLEINIIEGQFYNNVPSIKKCDDQHYELDYEIIDENNIDIKFTILDEGVEHKAGLIYDLSKSGFPLIEKYLFYTDDDNEEVYYDNF